MAPALISFSVQRFSSLAHRCRCAAIEGLMVVIGIFRTAGREDNAGVLRYATGRGRAEHDEGVSLRIVDRRDPTYGVIDGPTNAAREGNIGRVCQSQMRKVQCSWRDVPLSRHRIGGGPMIIRGVRLGG